MGFRVLGLGALGFRVWGLGALGLVLYGRGVYCVRGGQTFRPRLGPRFRINGCDHATCSITVGPPQVPGSTTEGSERL